MIHVFRAKNFYSLEGEASINFVVDERAPNDLSYAEAPSGVRLSLLEAVIGYNASGKTTILKALDVIRWLIVESYREDRPELPLKPFAACQDTTQPTELSVTFEMNGDILIYDLVLSRSHIISEELRIRNRSEKRVTSKKAFSRQWNDKSLSYDIADYGFGIPVASVDAKELDNTSLFSILSRFGHERSKKIVRYWSNFETNIELERHGWAPYAYEAYRALMFYRTHKKSRAKMEETVRRYDLGIAGFDFDGQGEVRHEFGDRSFKLEIDEESHGTQQLLALLKKIDNVLEHGSVAIIDELDAYLHPDMLKEFIDQFLDPEKNKKHAQLLLSTHNHELLSTISKYQIVLAEKNSNGSSEIRRLDTVPGVRSDDNYYTKYITGRLGARRPRAKK
jgi:uncharacterized protein